MSYSQNGIRERIRLYLINHDRNEKLLSGIPHRTFLDLAVVYRLLAIDGNSEDAEEITHLKMEDLGMNEEELYQAAMENMESDVRILSFGNKDNGSSAIYIVPSIACLTNSEKYKGSGIMLSKNTLSAFAEHFESNVLILPSSMHELMVVMDTGDDEQVDYLKLTVRGVNSDPRLLSKEDYLSDNVYRFNRQTQEITIA